MASDVLRFPGVFSIQPLRENPLEDMDTKLADVMSMREGNKDAASLQRYG